MKVLVLLCALAAVVAAEEALVFHETLPAPVPSSLVETMSQAKVVMGDMLAERAATTRLSDAALKRAFAKADKNDDGSLSRQELADFFGEKLSSQVVDLLWKRFDHDAKGGISESEFVNEFGKKYAKKEAEKKAEAEEPTENAEPKKKEPKADDNTKGTVEVDFLKATNSEDHHTEKYNEFHVVKGGTDLILRRGQSFYLSVTVPGETGDDLEKIVSFSIGGRRVKNVGRKGGFRSLTWACKPVGDSGAHSVKMKIWIPADMAMGRHKVEVLVRERATEAGEVIILFNAWSKYDDVHMGDETQRREYVEEDQGRIWYGDVVNGLEGITGLAWSFHQYEVLNVILDVIDSLKEEHRGDARLVARHLTWMLNSSKNKKGVLKGRWKADFPGGTPPAEWTGSREIFLKYKEQEYTPVKFGQCWVFSGILTTALRSIGIPSRPVTTFRSAHDKQPFDRVIDEEHSSDSIWNFHVWADAWMARGDVGHPEPEWNAVDATPQEKSTNGKMAMGPAAHHMIKANKAGEYDTEFVIGETNAVAWLGDKKYVKGMSLKEAGDTDYQDIGRAISTRKVGCDPSSEAHADMEACRHDVTGEYKDKDHPFELDRFEVKSHQFQTTLSPIRPRMGESFQVRIVRGDLPLDEDRVAIVITAEQILYTGERIGIIKAFEKHCRLSKDASAEDSCGDLSQGWSLEVSADEYAPFLSSGGSIRVRATIRGKDAAGMLQSNKDNGEATPPGYLGYAFERQFALTAPKLNISTVPAVVRRGESFGVVISFQNPIERPLTVLRATIDTPDYDRHAHFQGPVHPGAAVKLHTAQDFKVTKAGKASIHVSLLAQEVHGLYGSLDFNVAA